jgi:hypothetical protein
MYRTNRAGSRVRPANVAGRRSAKIVCVSTILGLACGCGESPSAAAAIPSPAAKSAPRSVATVEKQPDKQLAEADPSKQRKPLASGVAPVPAVCVAICHQASTLHCGTAEECAQGCREMLALPCQLPMASLLACLAKEPAEHWECDTESKAPTIKDGYCDAQQRGIQRAAAPWLATHSHTMDGFRHSLSQLRRQVQLRRRCSLELRHRPL